VPAGLTACGKIRMESHIPTKPFSPLGWFENGTVPYIRNGYRHWQAVRSAVKTIPTIRNKRGYRQAVRCAGLGNTTGGDECPQA